MVADSPTLEGTRQALADEWKRRDPIGDEGIATFYRDSQLMGADLDAWHATPERQEWTQAIVQVAGGNKAQRVLDVGAGGGHDLRALRRKFPDVFLAAVEPNDELRGRMAPWALTWSAIENVTGDYDLVLCIDVLEHVPDPEALLAEIVKRIPVGGILIEATATHDQSTPLHLPHIAEWQADESLALAGFEVMEQVGRLAIWQRTAEAGTLLPTVMVVAHREVTVPTVECLFELVGRGWPIAMVYGDALIDRARSKAASAWFKNEKTDVFLMIDDDIVFRPEDAERVCALAREKRSIACAAYPVADGGHMASRGWPGQELRFNPEQEPVEIRWPATGFMAVHRDVVAALVKTMEPCYPQNPDSFWPMFTPFALGPDYLSEDYAFGQRAMDLGFKTWLDPKAALIHLKVKGMSIHNMPGVERRKE